MATSIILRVADSESVEYARDTIGTSFTEYTGHTERAQGLGGQSVITEREMRQEEEHDFAKGEFMQFDAGECVIARQGKGYVHGRIKMLEE